MEAVKRHVVKNVTDPSSRQVVGFVALLLFLLGVMLTAVVLREISQQAEREHILNLQSRVTTLGTQIENRNSNYDRLLIASASRYSHEATLVTNQRWGWFVNDMDIQTTFPSLQGIGFAEYVNTADIPAYIDRMKAEGFTSIQYRADTDKYDDHAIVSYLMPHNSANTKAVGYDMMSESRRRVAIETARDSGRVATTEPVTLLQDSDRGVDNVYGILKYFPIYRGAYIPTAVDARKNEIYGFSYLVSRPRDFFENILKHDPSIGRDINIRVDDVTSNESYELFSRSDAAPSRKPLESYSADFSFGNRIWTVTAEGNDTSVNKFYGSGAVFGLGVLLSAALAGILYWILRSRFAHVEEKVETEIQRSKDELLALASHQLRTPASGVKQYLGLLSGGMLGELNEMQREVTRKAYDANERQLEIINELLYVSKIDAGQLHIQPRRTNITELIRRSIDNFEEQASHKNISLVFAKSTPDYFIHVDDRYIGMAIENLISNAIKYSHPDSKVTMKVTNTRQKLEFSVTDRGVGVAEADIPEIFGKFNRVDNVLSRKEGGSGLGLFLAKQLATAHGGDIRVTSKEGKGSTFTLVLSRTHHLSPKTVDLSDASGVK